jgi:phage repressor protein C with HTH and peptisase S24 domain
MAFLHSVGCVVLLFVGGDLHEYYTRMRIMSTNNSYDMRIILNNLKFALKMDTWKEVALFIGESESTLSSWKTRNTQSALAKILYKCKGVVSEDDLLENAIARGDQEVYYSYQPEKRVTAPQYAHKVEISDRLTLSDSVNPAFRAVPKAKQRLSAGNGRFVIDESAADFYHFREDWLHRACQPNEAILFDVDGDSMEPDIKDKDIVLIDRSSKDFIHDKIFAIGIGKDVLLKRLKRDMSGKILVVSDNRPPEDHQLVEEHELRILGKLVWRGGNIN